MKRLIAAVVAALVALAVIAIFARPPAHKVVVKPRVTVKSVQPATTAKSPTPCDHSSVSMQCVLSTLPAPSKTFSLSPGQTYGVDFGWSSVSASYAKQIGAKFGASYLSPDGTKNWTLTLVNGYHALGLGTVAVWESTATRAEQGYAAGRADAIEARTQAARLGNKDRPILFAVDCDCSGSAIVSYFEGVHSVIPHRDDAYGGYDQIAYLHSLGLVGNDNWQTYAWSGDRWLPSSIAPLEQYLNGSSFDNDRALRADYGQWPYTAPKPHKSHTNVVNKKPSTSAVHLNWFDGKKRHTPFGRMSERSVIEHYRGARGKAKYQGTAYLRKLEHESAWFNGRLWNVARAQRNHGHLAWGRFHRGYRQVLTGRAKHGVKKL